jgi:hypothetical protein
VLAVIVEVIIGKGNTFEQCDSAGSNLARAEATIAWTPPLQKIFAPDTMGNKAASEP